MSDFKAVDNKLEITEVIPEQTKVTSLGLDELYTILQQHVASKESHLKVIAEHQAEVDTQDIEIAKYEDLIRQAKELGVKTEAELAEEGVLPIVEVKPEEPKVEEQIGG